MKETLRPPTRPHSQHGGGATVSFSSAMTVTNGSNINGNGGYVSSPAPFSSLGSSLIRLGASQHSIITKERGFFRIIELGENAALARVSAHRTEVAST